MHVNLLPVAYQRRSLLCRFARRWVMVWAGVVLVVAIVAMDQWQMIHQLEDRRETILAVYQPVRQLQEQTVTLAAQRAAKARQAADLKALESDGRTVRLLGLLSQQRATAGEAFQLHTLSAMPAAAAPAAERKRAPASPPAAALQRPWLITLTGAASGDTAVNELIVTLRESKCFGRVELKSIINGPAGDTLRRDWAIELDY